MQWSGQLLGLFGLGLPVKMGIEWLRGRRDINHLRHQRQVRHRSSERSFERTLIPANVRQSLATLNSGVGTAGGCS